MTTSLSLPGQADGGVVVGVDLGAAPADGGAGGEKHEAREQDASHERLLAPDEGGCKLRYAKCKGYAGP